MSGDGFSHLLRADLAVESFDDASQASLKHALAAEYGVTANAVVLSASGGSTLVQVTIQARVEGQALSSVQPNATALGASTGVGLSVGNWSVIERSASVNVSQLVTSTTVCPAGFWCAADLPVACLPGYYNPNTGATNQTACIACPANSVTEGTNSTAIGECVCDREYYASAGFAGSSNASGEVVCTPCGVGMTCPQQLVGITLGTLPIKVGYYRASITTADVIRCPDAGAGCGAERECPESRSGCRGGRDPASACSDDLTGTFCRLCLATHAPSNASTNATTATRVYYVSANDTDVAHCEPCGSTMGTTIAMAFGIIGGVVLTLQLGWMAVRRGVRFEARAAALALARRQWESFSIGAKLKIVVTFYMISSKVGRICNRRARVEPSRPLSHCTLSRTFSRTLPSLAPSLAPHPPSHPLSHRTLSEDACSSVGDALAAVAKAVF